MGIVSLIGLMCSGKDTVGTHLAKRLEASLVVTDELIEQSVGETISAYVSANGMPAFRREESRVIEYLELVYRGKDAVFSIGGGAVAHDERPNYSEENIRHLHSLGKVVYLSPSDDPKVAVAILTERLKRDKSSRTKRPAMYQGEKPEAIFQKMMDSRDARYKAAAHYVVYTGNDSPEAVARKIHVLISTPSSK